ncbi:MAG: serine protease [Myxococcales bacterium]
MAAGASRTPLSLLLVALAACAPSPSGAADERQLRQATVSLEGFCAGVVVGDTEVLTAAHCIDELGQSIRIHYATGATGQGVAVAVDRASDLAVLRLAGRAPVKPLSLRASPAKVGETVLFTGRNDFRHPLQRAEVERFGRCPSLPKVPRALFTTIHAIPGDSGSPLVDGDFRIVGLVHGGARCHIAAPTEGAPTLLARAKKAAIGVRPNAAARRISRQRPSCPPSPRSR